MHTSCHVSHFLSLIESENILRGNWSDLKKMKQQDWEMQCTKPFFLRPSCVSERVGVNKKVVKQKLYSQKK